MAKVNPFDINTHVEKSFNDRWVETLINEIREVLDDGKADWYDATFFESVEMQFLQKGELSQKQIAALERIREIFEDKGYL